MNWPLDLPSLSNTTHSQPRGAGIVGGVECGYLGFRLYNGETSGVLRNRVTQQQTPILRHTTELQNNNTDVTLFCCDNYTIMVYYITVFAAKNRIHFLNVFCRN